MTSDNGARRAAFATERRRKQFAILTRKNNGARHDELAREFGLTRSGISEALRKARHQSALADKLSTILKYYVEPWVLDHRSMDLLIEYGRSLEALFGEEEENLNWLERWLLRQPMMGPVKVARVMVYLNTQRSCATVI